MRIAVFGRISNKKIIQDIQNLIHTMEVMGFSFSIYNDLYQNISKKISWQKTPDVFSCHKDIIGNTDILFSIGGDGTLLDTIPLIRDSGIPVLGINAGRLGFLADVSMEEFSKAMNRIVKKKYVLDERILLKLETTTPFFGQDNYALNEITVQKKNTSSMITIHASINGKFLNSYWADGLIVSTPTGSTAYSLSCGGPILLPENKNFIISPISPHNLNVRPIVVPDESIITLQVEGRSGTFMTSLDSRSTSLPVNEELKISRAGFPFNLVKFNDSDFLSTIRNKLMWGMDKRN